jgi:hypothetical protein
MTLCTAHYLVPMAHTPTNVDLLGEADNSTWLATSDPTVDCLPQFPTKSRSAPGVVRKSTSRQFPSLGETLGLTAYNLRLLGNDHDGRSLPTLGVNQISRDQS